MSIYDSTTKAAAQAARQGNFTPLLDDDTAGYGIHIPAELRERGLRIAHTRPLVTPQAQEIQQSFRVGPESAWRFPRLEINPAHCWAAMIFDCDRPPDLLAVYPVPHWEVVNTLSGHSQIGYILDTPVHRGKGSRRHPQDYAAATYAALRRKLGADAGYNGVLARNPAAPGDDCHTIYYARTETYDLAELADYVDLPPYRRADEAIDGPAVRPAGQLLEAYRVGYIGRNVYLHRWGVSRGFGVARRVGVGEPLQDAIFELLDARNWRLWVDGDFAARLSDSEVGWIAKSIAKMVSRNYDPAAFAAVQQIRGQRSGEVRRERTAERDEDIFHAYYVAGYNQAEIGGLFGISQQAVSKIIRRLNWLLEADSGRQKPGDRT